MARRHQSRLAADRVWAVYLIAATIAGVLYLFVPPFSRNGPFFNVLGLSTAVAILAGVWLHKPQDRLPWYLFALGQALFVIGDVIYYTWPHFTGTEVPYPSAPDGFYLAVYPAYVAGMLLLIRARGSYPNRASLIDALIVGIGVGVVSWIFLIAPYADDAGHSAMYQAISIAYPLMDLLLLTVTVRLAVGPGDRPPAFALLVGGAALLFLTDSVFGWVQLNGKYTPGGLLDAGWLAFYFLWGAAALHPSMRTLSERAPDTPARHARARLLMLTGAALLAPGVAAVQLLRDEPVSQGIVIGGSIALFLLAAARMSGLVRQHEQAEHREHALRIAGDELVAAATREDTYDAALSAVGKLAGPGTDVTFYVSAGGPRVSPASARFEPVAASVRDADGIPTLKASELPERTWSVLVEGRSAEMALGQERLLLVPLRTQGQIGGLFEIRRAAPVPRVVRDSLETLAAETALALEAANIAEDRHRRQSEARFRSLVQHASDLITVVEPDGTIRYQSPSVARVLGYGGDDLLGTDVMALIHPDDVVVIEAVLAGAPLAAPDATEARWRRRDGTWMDAETVWTDLTGDPNVGGIVLTTRDITEHKAFEQQLEHQAFHDSMTNLANRALFRNRVGHALERRAQHHAPVAVLFLDLDDFKTVNDSLGHPAGDRLLVGVSERLLAVLRPADTAARLGGDEFAVLLEAIEEQEAAVIAERIMAVLLPAFPIHGMEVIVRASIGITVARPGQAVGVDELLRQADVAMFNAKAEGKGRYCLFEPDMHAQAMRRLELKADLQRAVDREELILHYQPLYDLRDQRVMGVEALARWPHPSRGMVPPSDFVPLAEETGLIASLGAFLLTEACHEAVRLQERFASEPPLWMSVNVSARQLADPSLVDDVAHALAASRLDPARLTLEITESVMMADPQGAADRLAALKGLGVHLAVDDFGTGYSSLNYLRSFPIDVLKIDKSFVDRIEDSSENLALMGAIVQMASVLGMRSLAEGIEEESQLERLVAMGCQYGQGFLLSRPLDRDHLESLIESAHTPS